MGLGTGAASEMDHTVRSGLSPAYSPQLSTLKLSKQSPCCAVCLFPEAEPRLLGRRRAGATRDLCPGAGRAPRPHSGGPKSCTAAPGPALPLLQLLYPRLLCSGCLQDLVWMRPKGAAPKEQPAPGPCFPGRPGRSSCSCATPVPRPQGTPAPAPGSGCAGASPWYTPGFSVGKRQCGLSKAKDLLLWNLNLTYLVTIVISEI